MVTSKHNSPNSRREIAISFQRAAAVLNASREHVVELVADGSIPDRTTGTRRCIRLADVLAYRDSEVTARHRGLDDLVAEAQELGMYNA